jgi:hypothetical protein
MKAPGVLRPVRRRRVARPAAAQVAPLARKDKAPAVGGPGLRGPARSTRKEAGLAGMDPAPGGKVPASVGFVQPVLGAAGGPGPFSDPVPSGGCR